MIVAVGARVRVVVTNGSPIISSPLPVVSTMMMMVAIIAVVVTKSPVDSSGLCRLITE